MKRIHLRSLFALSVTIGALLAPVSAFAASSPSVNTSTSTLKISPLRTDLTVNPGAVGKVTVTAYNTTNAPILLKAIENDFTAGDENGKPAVIIDENSYAPTHSLKRFMLPLSTVTVPAKSSTDVTVTITVPKTAQAGGYFGAIRLAPATDSTGQQVNIGASVVSLILLTVPGPTVDQLTMTNFDVQQNGGSATSFRTPDNLALFLRFENKGNVQDAPFGQIYIQQGKKVVYKHDFNTTDPKDVLLPDSARRWQIPLKGFSKFGKYTVGATFAYGSKGQTIEIKKTVWIVPTVYILTIVGAVVVLAVAIGGSWMFLRNYKRRILRSSRRRY